MPGPNPNLCFRYQCKHIFLFGASPDSQPRLMLVRFVKIKESEEDLSFCFVLLYSDEFMLNLLNIYEEYLVFATEETKSILE
jgi:hypothetical protein